MRFRVRPVIFLLAFHIAAMFEVTLPQFQDTGDIDSDELYPQTCLHDGDYDSECNEWYSGTPLETEFQGTILRDECELDCEDDDEDSCYQEGFPIYYMSELLETDIIEDAINISEDEKPTDETSTIDLPLETDIIEDIINIPEDEEPTTETSTIDDNVIETVNTPDDEDTTTETYTVDDIDAQTIILTTDPTTTTSTISLTEIQTIVETVAPTAINHKMSSTSETPTSSSIEVPTSTPTDAATSSTTEAPRTFTTDAPTSSTTEVATTVSSEAPSSSTTQAEIANVEAEAIITAVES